MTLSGWFRDYVYIPLGGNRVGKGRWVLNILVVWMLTGLWHGAAWNFVLWGLLYAAFLMVEKWLPLYKLPDLLRRVYVLLIVVLGFVLFNADSLGQVVSDMKGIFGFGGVPFINSNTWYHLQGNAVLFLAAVVGATPLAKKLGGKLSGKTVGLALEPVLLIALLLLCTAYLVDGSFNPFLYFRF